MVRGVWESERGVDEGKGCENRALAPAPPRCPSISRRSLQVALRHLGIRWKYLNKYYLLKLE